MLDYIFLCLGMLMLLIVLIVGVKGVVFLIVYYFGFLLLCEGFGCLVFCVYLVNVMGFVLGLLVIGFWMLNVLWVESVWVILVIGIVMFVLVCLVVVL